MPAPCDGIHVSPSLSVIADRLSVPPTTPSDGIHVPPSLPVIPDRLSVLATTSCETIVRPFFESVQRIGSKLSVPVIGDCLATQVDVGLVGQESSKFTLNVVTNDWKRTLPVIQFEPMEGSPASMPRPLANCAADGVKRLKRGGSPLAGVAAGNGM